MEEIKVALHMHTVYSDGSGTHAELAQDGLKAGIDAIIVTDHNVWVQEMEGYTRQGKKKVLLLVGEEIHDQTRKVGGNHLLVMGHNRELARFASKPQTLIDQVRASGGLSFIAHPFDDPLPMFKEDSFDWVDWDVSGFNGIELWNQMSEFKTRSGTLPKAALHAFLPQFMGLGPLERTLALWDELMVTRKTPIVAVAGVDAHRLHKQVGPLKITLYPYEFQFRSFNNHLLLPGPLTGELNADKAAIYDALRQGHLFLAYDQARATDGFRFNVNNNEGQFIMGDTVKAESGLTFQARLPFRTHARLLKDGKPVQESWDREVITHITKEPGVYRVEVFIDYLGRHRGWIFSNPIYAV